MNVNIVIGNTISFIPKYTGAVLTIGKVAGILSYDVAKTLGDIVAVHAAVKQADPTVGDVADQEFFALVIDGKTSVFADAWITSGSLSVVNEAVYTDLRVYGVDSNTLSTLKAYMQTGGYTVKVI